MASYQELASNYASGKRQEYENSLSYLTEDLAAKNQLDQQNLTTQYNNLVNTLNTNYAKDAKSAYINKMLAGQALDESLANMGVSTQGFGLTQRMNNETNYGATLGSLQDTLGENITNAGNELQSNLSTLQSNYLGDLSNLKMQIQNMSDDYYNREYNNYYNELVRQEEANRYWAEQNSAQNRYNELMAQEGIDEYNNYKATTEKQNQAYNTMLNLISKQGSTQYATQEQANQNNYFGLIRDANNRKRTASAYETWKDSTATNLNDLYNRGMLTNEQLQQLLQKLDTYKYSK